MSIIIKTSLSLFTLLSTIKGDQPIKCEKSSGDLNYVNGIWTLHSSP